MLLGVGTWASILNDKLVKLSSKLICQESRLGNIIYGQTGEEELGEIKEIKHVHSIEENSIEELNRAIKRHK